jgi:hypothetical protein
VTPSLFCVITFHVTLESESSYVCFENDRRTSSIEVLISYAFGIFDRQMQKTSILFGRCLLLCHHAIQSLNCYIAS